MIKYFSTIIACLTIASSAHAAAYMKLDDIKGESTDDSASSTATLQVAPISTRSSSSAQASSLARSASSQAQAGVEPDEIDYDDAQKGVEPDEIDYNDDQKGIEPDEIDYMGEDNESTAAASASSKSGTKKGNVEYEWKVEEGEAMQEPGVEPDEIDVDDNGGPQETNFALLLSSGDAGGDDDDDDEGEEEKRERIEDILLQQMQQTGDTMPMEEVSFNYEKIKVRVKKSVKLFGFIPLTARPTVEVDAEERVKVRFPWWAFLASGKDTEALGDDVFAKLSAALDARINDLLQL